MRTGTYLGLPDGWKYLLEVIEGHYVPDVFDRVETSTKK
jgi:hypothetical protein